MTAKANSTLAQGSLGWISAAMATAMRKTTAMPLATEKRFMRLPPAGRDGRAGKDAYPRRFAFDHQGASKGSQQRVAARSYSRLLIACAAMHSLMLSSRLRFKGRFTNFR